MVREIWFQRYWSMPNSETFRVPIIESFVRRYILRSKISIDPFARNSKMALYTNDINPNTSAKYHMDALKFLNKSSVQKVGADLVIFDPPYSLGQMKECYENMGRKISLREFQRFYGDIRDAIDKVVVPGGFVLSFGWNSIGMGIGRKYKIIEGIIVCHGRAHNDTICVAERKLK